MANGVIGTKNQATAQGRRLRKELLDALRRVGGELGESVEPGATIPSVGELGAGAPGPQGIETPGITFPESSEALGAAAPPPAGLPAGPSQPLSPAAQGLPDVFSPLAAQGLRQAPVDLQQFLEQQRQQQQVATEVPQGDSGRTVFQGLGVGVPTETALPALQKGVSVNLDQIVADLEARAPEQPEGVGRFEEFSRFLGGAAGGALAGLRGGPGRAGTVGEVLAGAGAGGGGALAGLRGEQRDAHNEFLARQDTHFRAVANAKLANETAKAQATNQSIDAHNRLKIAKYEQDRATRLEMRRARITPLGNGKAAIVTGDGRIIVDTLDQTAADEAALDVATKQAVLRGLQLDNDSAFLLAQEINLGEAPPGLESAWLIGKQIMQQPTSPQFQSLLAEAMERFPETAALLSPTGAIAAGKTTEEALNEVGATIHSLFVEKYQKSRDAWEAGLPTAEDGTPAEFWMEVERQVQTQNELIKSRSGGKSERQLPGNEPLTRSVEGGGAPGLSVPRGDLSERLSESLRLLDEGGL